MRMSAIFTFSVGLAGCSAGGAGLMSTDASVSPASTPDASAIIEGGRLDDRPGSPSRDSSTPSCQGGGGSCGNGVDCCSNRCVDGVCDSCAGAGESCGASGACCPNITPRLTCFGGACLACLGGGATCKKTSDCCSRACTGGTCEAPTACRDDGASCTSSAQCCDGRPCVDGACGCNVLPTLANEFPQIPSLCTAPLQTCCVETSACLASTGCKSLVTCKIGCTPSDTSCLSSCTTSASAGTKSLFGALAQCLSANGAGACVP